MRHDLPILAFELQTCHASHDCPDLSAMNAALEELESYNHRTPDVTFTVTMAEFVGISRRGWDKFRATVDGLYDLCGCRETPIDPVGDRRRIDIWWTPGKEREGAKALQALFAVIWPDRFAPLDPTP